MQRQIWKKFDFNKPATGPLWVVFSFPDHDVDVNSFGEMTGEYTGHIGYKPLMVMVDLDHDGSPVFRHIDLDNEGLVADEYVAVCYKEIELPDVPDPFNYYEWGECFNQRNFKEGPFFTLSLIKNGDGDYQMAVTFNMITASCDDDNPLFDAISMAKFGFVSKEDIVIAYREPVAPLFLPEMLKNNSLEIVNNA